MSRIRRALRFFNDYLYGRGTKEGDVKEGETENSEKSNSEYLARDQMISNSIAEMGTFAELKSLSRDKSQLSKEITEMIRENGINFRRTGHYDGAIGRKFGSIRDLAVVSINMIKDHVQTSFRGKKDAYETEMKVREEIHKKAKEIYNTQFESYKKLKNYKDKFPKHHSILLFLLYLFIALFLIFADVPLALNLTERGFDLKSSQDPNYVDFEITEFFRYPMIVIQNYWEVFLISFGIALCTIYIKILYDELIGNPSHTVVTRYKDIPNVEEDEVGEIKREDRRRRGIKLGILGLTLLTIVALGVFRFETLKNDPSNDIGNSFFTQLTFILITLLFPVIGGICFSISLSNVQNVMNLWSASRKFKSKQRQYTKALEEFNTAQQKFHDIQGYLKDWDEEGVIAKNYVNFLVAAYNHGFEWGHSHPELYLEGKDLYEKTEKLRNKLIARRIFDTAYNFSKSPN